MGILDVKYQWFRVEALQTADERLPEGVEVGQGLDYKEHKENFGYLR